MKKISRMISLIVLASFAQFSGMNAMQQRLKSGVQSAKGAVSGFWQEKVVPKASPAMQSANKFVQDLTGISACINANNCTPEQLRQYKVAVNGLKALAAAGLLAAVGVGMYKGYQKYGDQLPVNLPTTQEVLQRFDAYGKSLVQQLLSLRDSGKKWTPASWKQFKAMLREYAEKTTPETLSQAMGVLHGIEMWAGQVGARSSDAKGVLKGLREMKMKKVFAP